MTKLKHFFLNTYTNEVSQLHIGTVDICNRIGYILASKMDGSGNEEERKGKAKHRKNSQTHTHEMIASRCLRFNNSDLIYTWDTHSRYIAYVRLKIASK